MHSTPQQDREKKNQMIGIVCAMHYGYMNVYRHTLMMFDSGQALVITPNDL